MISAYEILRHLYLDNVQVAYSNDTYAKNNVVIYVSESVGIDKVTTQIDVRSVQNKGSTATNLAKKLLSLNNKVFEFELEDGSKIKRTLFFENFVSNGVDDKQRMSMSSTLTIK